MLDPPRAPRDKPAFPCPRLGAHQREDPVEKPAQTDHAIHDLIARRYSPRAFGDEAVTIEQMRSLLEAARWASSCFNEQPWHYLVAMRGDTEAFERMLGCLVDFNRQWAAQSSVLLISVARMAFAQSGEVNRHAWHDVGQATALMAIQATSMGLCIHPMAGFDRDEARRIYRIPEGHEPVAAIAVGYPGDPARLSEKLRARELAPRQRRPLADFVHGGAFGEPLAGLTK